MSREYRLLLTACCLLGSAFAQPPIPFSNGYAIVNGVVTPSPPADLTAGPGDRQTGTVYEIVQFKGPLHHYWLEQLAASGIQPVAYLPDWAVVARMDASQQTRASGFDFVGWTGPFQPAFKLQSQVLSEDTVASLAVTPFPDHNVDSLASAIRQTGVLVKGCEGRTILVAADRAGAARIAQLSAVEWIQEEIGPVELYNANVEWVMQTGWRPLVPPDAIGRRIWHKGIKGKGVVVSISDEGLNPDHEMFVDPRVPIRDVGIYLHHRKIVAYKLDSNASYGDFPEYEHHTIYHGDMVVCTAVGNDSGTGSTNPNNGVAPEARLYYLSVFYNNGVPMFSPDDLTSFFDTIYQPQGLPFPVRQTSISWGLRNPQGAYGDMDASTDAALWRYPDLLTIVASGNTGLGGNTTPRPCHPACAKNVLTVGACGDGIWSDSFFSSFSTPGPTQDGRYKPEIVAPGSQIWSASGPQDNSYDNQSGTSLSAPAVNGASALIREYLAEGWYPGGMRDSGERIGVPSSALMRAMAIVSADPNVSQLEDTVPDMNIGWGRMDLDSVLYFAGDQRKLVLDDNLDGLSTGETRVYSVDVDSRIPLRACLAWTDTAAMPNADTTLVNNLDLVVASPGPYVQFYNGNIYFAGQSAGNLPFFDAVNNEECFRLNYPPTGRWTFEVYARNVFTHAQPYALVITGDCQTTGVEEGKTAPLTLRPELVLSTPVRRRASLRYDLPRAGYVSLQAFDRNGRCARTLEQGQDAAGVHPMTWDLTDDHGRRLPAGVYFIRLKAGNQELTRKMVVAE